VEFVAVYIAQNLAEKTRKLAIAISEMFFRVFRAPFPPRLRVSA
jgi:phenylpyruvate tautomerase PptA (4-oxalocrotonate tautomerase family)